MKAPFFERHSYLVLKKIKVQNSCIKNLDNLDKICIEEWARRPYSRDLCLFSILEKNTVIANKGHSTKNFT